MAGSLNTRIEKRLQALELTPRAASLKAGLSADFLRSLFSGRTRSPSLETVERLAEILECEAPWLAFGTPPLQDGSHPPPSRLVPILGQVAAGAWHEIDDSVDEPRHNRQLVADPRFPAEAQYGLTAVGESMNMLFADQDDLLCLDFTRVPGGLEPSHDDVVIVEQLRGGGLLRECSAKQLKLTPEGPVLLARSTHPKWHDFRLVPTSANDNDAHEVAIKAIVLRSERQWWSG